MSFSNKLKELRIDRNLTQEQLAKLIEVHPKTYKNYETGKTLPRIAVIRKLAIVLEISSDELLEMQIK